MKPLFRLLFCLLLGTSLSAQSGSPLFYAYGNIASRIVNGGGTSYDITISNFNGGYREYPASNYDVTDITTGMVVWANCVRLVVTSVVSTSPLKLRVTDANSTGALTGTDLIGYRIFILQEATYSTYKIGAVGAVADGNAGSQAGASPADFACAQNYYRNQLGSALSSVSGGGSASAGNGLRLNSTTLEWGNPMGLTSALITRNTEIPTGGKKIGFSGTGQVIIGDTISKTYSSPTGSTYPKLSLVDNTTTDQNLNPMLSFKSNNDFGVIWEFNPSGIDTVSLPWGMYHGISRDIQPGINDPSYTFATNITAGGARKVTTKPSFGDTWETKYSIPNHGNCVEYYKNITAVNGTSVRWFEYYANRDSLYNASLYMSARQIGFRNLAGTDIWGMGLTRTSVDEASFTGNPGAGNGNVTINMNGTTSYSNIIRMKRPLGVSGAGAADNVIQYGVTTLGGTRPVLGIGSISNSVVDIQGGVLGLGVTGNSGSILPGNRVVHIGQTTMSGDFSSNYNAAIQIDYAAGTYWSINSGIETYSALRLQNNAFTKQWSLGADNSVFFLNYTTGAFRALEITEAGNTDFKATGYLKIPVGTTGQALTAAVGHIRVNTTTNQFTGVRSGTTVKNFLMDGDAVTDVLAVAVTSEKLTSVTGTTATFLTSIAAGVHASRIEIFKNGYLMESGGGNDYTVTSTTPLTITLAVAAVSTDKFIYKLR